MEDYKYKFQIEQDFTQRFNKSISDKVLRLYQNKVFKKLKLDKNEHIRFHANRPEKVFKPSGKIPDIPDIIPHSLTLYDVINFEDLIHKKTELIRLLSKFGGGPFARNPEREVNETLDRIKDNYKSQSIGNISYVSLEKQSSYELIKGIHIGYVTGEQSHIILIYTVFPSQKFINLFHQLLVEPVKDTREIIFNSLKNILKGKKWVSSIKHTPEYPEEKLRRIVLDLNYEFKNEFLKNFSLGLFNQSKNDLFPTILTYEYDVENTKNYLNEILDRLKCRAGHLYKKDKIIVNFSGYLKSDIQMFFPKKSDFQKEKDPFDTVDYFSENFTASLAPYWTSIKITEHHQTKYIHLRKKIFKYLNQNKDSIFLSKAINLRNDINLHFWKFRRVIDDFAHKKFVFHLSQLPKLLNEPRVPTQSPRDLKDDLILLTTSATQDLMESYKDLDETLKRISDDNVIKANINLQKILIALAVLGAMLTVYGANSNFINTKLKSLLEILTSL